MCDVCPPDVWPYGALSSRETDTCRAQEPGSFLFRDIAALLIDTSLGREDGRDAWPILPEDGRDAAAHPLEENAEESGKHGGHRQSAIFTMDFYIRGSSAAVGKREGGDLNLRRWN